MNPEERPSFIMQQLLAGNSYAEIGLKLGITRSRVEQIIEKHHLKERILRHYCPHWLTPKQAGERLNTSYHTIIWLCHQGKLRYTRLGRLILVAPNPYLSCLACGQPRAKGNSYCVPCRKEALHKAQANVGWRRLYRHLGQPLPPRLIPTRKRDYKKVKLLPEKA